VYFRALESGSKIIKPLLVSVRHINLAPPNVFNLGLNRRIDQRRIIGTIRGPIYAKPISVLHAISMGGVGEDQFAIG